MADLTYKVPIKPKRPFAVGDTVDVLDREHKVIGQQEIVLASSRVVGTACGRLWTKDGWRMDEDDRVWPFPSIRHTQRRR